ncbi:MAG: lysylphosphatidylglycerol synthase transmembrane domain-containing protein [Candidatus Acidiferrum sp.]
MRSSSRKLVIALLGLVVLGLVIYFSRGIIHLKDFSGAKLLHSVRNANPYLLILSIVAIYICYAIRALRWKVFQGNLGPSRFWQIYAMTLAGFSAIFLLGRAGEPVRPMLLARKEGLPFADMFGIYFLERIFDFASMAVIASIGLLLFKSHSRVGGAASTLESAAKTAGTFFFAAVVGAIAFLIYLRVHGTALLERRLHGWHGAHGWRALVARILIGFVRGIQAIRSFGELVAAVFYSAAHWFLVALVYLWVSHAFGGSLGTLNLGDALLVLAFTLAGSAVQLPGVGGGAQVATFIAFTAVLGVEKERAAAAAIVLWLISFAACSLAGVPLLLREGFSPGKLRELAQREEAEELEV